jgi:hypothetical protein
MFGSIPKKLHVPRTSHLLMIKLVKPEAPRIPRIKSWLTLQGGGPVCLFWFRTTVAIL